MDPKVQPIAIAIVASHFASEVLYPILCISHVIDFNTSAIITILTYLMVCIVNKQIIPPIPIIGLLPVYFIGTSEGSVVITYMYGLFINLLYCMIDADEYVSLYRCTLIPYMAMSLLSNWCPFICIMFVIDSVLAIINVCNKIKALAEIK